MGIKEDVFYEGGPHVGDLIFNILLAFTVICIPLTVGAIVRALWLRYRITSRRVSVIGGSMGKDQTDIIYNQVVKVVKVPRGVGLWGDLVITLKDKSRLELRAVPRFREIYDYISERAAIKKEQPAEAIAK